jgi:hypothetical protein
MQFVINIDKNGIRVSVILLQLLPHQGLLVDESCQVATALTHGLVARLVTTSPCVFGWNTSTDSWTSRATLNPCAK